METRLKTSFTKLSEKILEVSCNDISLVTVTYAVSEFESHKLLFEEYIINDLFLA